MKRYKWSIRGQEKYSGPQDQEKLEAHPDNQVWVRAELDPIEFEEVAGHVELPWPELHVLQRSNDPMAQMLFRAARRLGAFEDL